MPNIPTFSYRFRRCGVLKRWVSPALDICASEPKNPLLGSSLWQNEQPKVVNRPCPLCSSERRELSSFRIGFGGYWSWRTKSLKACISAADSGPLSRPSSPPKATLNAVNAAFSSKGSTGGTALPPVRSPRQCIGPCVAIPAQALRAGGALERVEGHAERARIGIGRDVAIRVPEIPREIVLVREDVTARARGFAVARCERGVVQEPAPLDDAGGLRIVERKVDELASGPEVDHGDRVVEARGDVEAVAQLVEREAAGTAAVHGDLVRQIGDEGVALERARIEDADLARPEGRDVERLPIARDFDPQRSGEAPLADPGRHGHGAVVDVLVEMARIHAASVDHRDASLVEVTAYRGRLSRLLARGIRSRALEAHLVPGFGVRHVDATAHRIHGHVEEHRPHVCEGAELDGGDAFASISNTSRSGRSKRTTLFQLRPSSSRHSPAAPAFG